MEYSLWPNNMNPVPLAPHANSFTFLRLMLALMVVFGHSYVLGGFGEEPLARLSGGTITGRELAVQGFFIISGYLLTNSLFRNQSLPHFFTRRAFRILPGYWLALLVTSFVVAPILFARLFPGKLTYAESLRLGDYNAIGYLTSNCVLWQKQKWILPLFLGNPSQGVVNGSLWSLFYEVLCYAMLALASFCGLLRRKWPMAIAFVLLYLPCLLYAVMPFPPLPKTSAGAEIFNMMFHPAGPRVGLAFAAGVFAQILDLRASAWHTHRFWGATLLFLISIPLGAGPLLWPVVFPYLLIALAERLPFQKLERVGDFSYGIYIYSFLIQQSLIALGGRAFGVTGFTLVSVVLSLAAGVGSWFCAERYAIRCGQKIIAWYSPPPAPSSALPTPRAAEHYP